jgi:hypothetical protein
MRLTSEDNSMSLTYFGVITQTTEEDWSRTRLVSMRVRYGWPAAAALTLACGCEQTLSTATPSVGGAIPKVGSRYIKAGSGIVHLMPASAAIPSRSMLSQSAMMNCDMSAPRGYGGGGGGGGDDEEDDEEGAEQEERPTGAVATARAQSSATSSSFSIERAATIAR